MKVCARNRKQITLLVMGAVDATQAESLRKHFLQCPGCRAYQEEIGAVTGQLSSMESTLNISSTPAFHQRLLRALDADDTGAKPLGHGFRALVFEWRVALSGVGATAIVLLALSIALHPRNGPVSTHVFSVNETHTVAQHELAPTLANYQTLMNRSLDGLDGLLDSQGTRPAASSPTFKVSTLAKATFPD